MESDPIYFLHAKTKNHFKELLESEFAKLAFDLVALEDVETLAKRLERLELPTELKTAIESISSDSLIAFGTFQAY